MPSRRRLLASAAASGVLLPLLPGLLPSLISPLVSTAQAATTAGKRRVLVIYAYGGWDPTWVFTDTLGSSLYYDPTAKRAQGSGGIPYIDSPERPAVRAFFEAWGHKTAIINGMQVRALTHPSALKLLMTDSAAPGIADWSATIAATSTDLDLPMVVSSGPVFPGLYGAQITRLGESGQLSALLDGSALAGSTQPTSPLSGTASDAVNAYLSGRSAALSTDPFVADYRTALDRMHQVASLQDQIDLGLDYSADISVAARVSPALDCLELGLTRVVLVAHPGFRSGWDHHSGIEQQSGHYQFLFEDLKAIVDSMAARPGTQGGTLLDETAILVCSEMGRAPLLNAAGGKDHWVWTTAMLVGSGVQGGTVVGEYDSDFEGVAMDMERGEPDSGGTIMDSGHLGATLCELTGTARPEHIAGKAPIAGVLA